MQYFVLFNLGRILTNWSPAQPNAVRFALKGQTWRLSHRLALRLFQKSQNCWVVRALDVQSADPELKSCSDHQLDLFQVVSASASQLGLYITNWAAAIQLGFLTCSVNLLYSAFICISSSNEFSFSFLFCLITSVEISLVFLEHVVVCYLHFFLWNVLHKRFLLSRLCSFSFDLE